MPHEPVAQADGDDGEATPDVESLLEQRQDVGRGDQDEAVEGLSSTASDRGMDTAGSGGQRWELTTECGLCGGRAELVSMKRENRWGQRHAVVLDEFYVCEKCDANFYEPGQMDAVIARVKEALDGEPIMSRDQDAAIRLLQRQVKALQDYIDDSLPSGITRRWRNFPDAS